jgi:hypothetical protein
MVYGFLFMVLQTGKPKPVLKNKLLLVFFSPHIAT